MHIRWLENALSLDATIGKSERYKRTVFFSTFAIMLFVNLVNLFVLGTTSGGRYIYTFGTIVSVGEALFAVLIIVCKRRLSVTIIVGISIVGWITIAISDYTARAAGNTIWVMMVLVVDFLLVMQVDTRFSMVAVCTTVLYLIAMAVEERFRFGILDMPGLMTQEERWSRVVEQSTCTTLPCTRDTTSYLSASLAVFVIDFLATRGFARAILKEQEAMQRTIATVQEIASLLAGYDVEQVAGLLEEHGGDMPEGMVAALRQLEENLRMYKAYLPQTCLPFEVATEQCAEFGDLDGADSDHQSSLSLSASNTSAPARRTSFRAQPIQLSSANATLLTLNIKDTLRRLEEDSARFSQLFTSVLLKTLQATDSRRGMVDVFVGDRIHCSFNTSKPCVSHATSALHATSMLMRAGLAASVNVGVAMGKVLRGDMGCDVMRRFSMVGTLVRDVHGMERAGRMLGCDVVCNRMCFSDAECEHDLRLLPCKVEVARDCEPEVVAELVSKEEDVLAVVDEWMYQIGGKKHWDLYNTVVRGYLRDECRDTDVAKAWVEAGGSGTPAHAVPSGTCSVVCSYLR